MMPSWSSIKYHYLVFAYLAIAGIYLLGTQPCVRDQMDCDGHHQHITSVADGVLLPPANSCWECHQPPSYYWASGLILWTQAKAQSSTDPFRLLQFFGLLLMLIVAFLGARFLHNQFIQDKILRLLLPLFWVLFPATIFHSARTGNDILFYVFHILIVVLLHEFLAPPAHPKAQSKSMSFFAPVVLGLCLFVKASGLALWILFAFVMLQSYFLVLPKPPIKKFVMSCVPAALIFSFSYAGLKILLAYKGAISMTGAEYLHSEWKIPNGVENYLSFFPIEMIKNPWMAASATQTDGVSFLNYYFKSSLFGEYTFSSVGLAQILISIWLVLLSLIFGFAYQLRKHPAAIFHYFHIALCLAITMAYRWRFPFGCNSDFRYFFPVLISYLYILGLIYMRMQNRWLKAAFAIALVVFSVTSAILMITTAHKA